MRWPQSPLPETLDSTSVPRSSLDNVLGSGPCPGRTDMVCRSRTSGTTSGGPTKTETDVTRY